MGSATIPILQATAWMHPSPSRNPATQIQSTHQMRHPMVKFRGSKALHGDATSKLSLPGCWDLQW